MNHACGMAHKKCDKKVQYTAILNPQNINMTAQDHPSINLGVINVWYMKVNVTSTLSDIGNRGGYSYHCQNKMVILTHGGCHSCKD